MNISVEKLLNKIELELQEAKKADTEARLRESIYSIKTLCDLVIDEKLEKSKTELSEPVFKQQSLTYHHSEQINMDDEANGNSIFDF
ncbi:YwdI family protein [Bacillus aquiflavi]|uniref:YwdI family protein n=1 Tax=Bacillus aquiflavi TaxID=2672567 RepID=A0A6B3VZK0_9BACI|nr:YwdI family protein [Bacillus aquiflavi]MBA4537432.1 YwdI family protein [Bacillus aquiflavi]NEY81687.1 YwdI family protein [Bacillus aquiflavi]UAC47973.1 YwdI family protein [Bacillus aquiflavi]